MLFLVLMLGAVTFQPAQEVVTIRATGDCPSGAAVREKLDKLVGTAGPGRAPDLAEVEVTGSTLAITLRRVTGEVVGDKRLPLGAGCAERAESAAIVLAAWEAQLGDHAATALVPPVTPPPAGDAAPGASPPPEPPPPPAAAVSRLASRPGRAAPPAGPPARWAPSPGGSLLASIDTDNTALAAVAEAAVSRQGSPFAFGGGAMFVSSHVTSVAPGTGSWWRFGLAVDARRRARWSGFWLEGRVGAALTLLRISGSNLSVNGSATVLDPGALAGLRLGLVESPASPWLEIGTVLWPRRETLQVSGGGATDLPIVDALVGVGFSIERSP